jgi:hypothetical protein
VKFATGRPYVTTGAAIAVIVALLLVPRAAAAADNRPTEMIAHAGTLIVGIPSAEGLVVAGDSRRTLNGLACDFGTKLFVPENLPSTVFGFTGLSSYSAIRPSASCQEIETAPIVFDIEPTVRNFLQGHPSSIRDLDIVALADQCVAAFSRFVGTSGPLIDRAALVTRGFVFTVVLAAYEPDTRTSILREISIRLRSTSEIAAEQTGFDSYEPTGRPDGSSFGQGGYLTEHVLNGPGQQFLSDSYQRFKNARTIDQVSSDLAIQVAENLIEATSKTSELIQIPAGVGGHTDVYFLSKDGTRKIK